MSVISKYRVEEICKRILETYQVIEYKGGKVPEGAGTDPSDFRNLENLPVAIRSLSAKKGKLPVRCNATQKKFDYWISDEMAYTSMKYGPFKMLVQGCVDDGKAGASENMFQANLYDGSSFTICDALSGELLYHKLASMKSVDTVDRYIPIAKLLVTPFESGGEGYCGIATPYYICHKILANTTSGPFVITDTAFDEDVKMMIKDQYYSIEAVPLFTFSDSKYLEDVGKYNFRVYMHLDPYTPSPAFGPMLPCTFIRDLTANYSVSGPVQNASDLNRVMLHLHMFDLDCTAGDSGTTNEQAAIYVYDDNYLPPDNTYRVDYASSIPKRVCFPEELKIAMGMYGYGYYRKSLGTFLEHDATEFSLYLGEYIDGITGFRDHYDFDA